MKPTHLIELHHILSLMVRSEKISVDEKNQLLYKAGLSQISETEWVGDNNTIYKFNEI